MSILVIGLGSMGKRRIRDLLYLQKDEVTGWDPRDDRRKEAEQRFGIRTFSSLEEAMREPIRAMVISTPPDTHMQYAHMAADRNIPFFTEASVTSEGMSSLIAKLSAAPQLLAAPSCTMMFHPAVSIIRDLVKQNAVGEKMFFIIIPGSTCLIGILMKITGTTMCPKKRRVDAERSSRSNGCGLLLYLVPSTIWLPQSGR